MPQALSRKTLPALPLAPVMQFEEDVRKEIPNLFPVARDRTHAEELILPLFDRGKLVSAPDVRREEDVILSEIELATGFRPARIACVPEDAMADRKHQPYAQCLPAWLYKTHGHAIAERLRLHHGDVLLKSTMQFGIGRSLAWYYLCFHKMGDALRMRRLIPIMRRSANLLIFGSSPHDKYEWVVMTGA